MVGGSSSTDPLFTDDVFAAWQDNRPDIADSFISLKKEVVAMLHTATGDDDENANPNVME
jgi:hypothetical protein